MQFFHNMFSLLLGRKSIPVHFVISVTKKNIINLNSWQLVCVHKIRLSKLYLSFLFKSVISSEAWLTIFSLIDTVPDSCWFIDSRDTILRFCVSIWLTRPSLLLVCFSNLASMSSSRPFRSHAGLFLPPPPPLPANQ